MEHTTRPHLTLNQRISVIHMRARNVPYAKIADELNISISTAQSIVRIYRENGRIGRKKGVWPNRVAVHEVRHQIDASLKANPFLKGKELQEIVYQRTGKSFNLGEDHQ